MAKGKKVFQFAFLTGLIFALVIGVLALGTFNSPVKIKEKLGVKEETRVKEEPILIEPVNILVLGIDQRGNEKSRTDTIMVYRVDPIRKEIKLLSIPRDTYVNIPGRGMDKINHAHAFGDIELAVKTVEEFLGIKIDYYAKTNFVGFEKLVESLGGVTIDVEKNIRQGDIFISKGLHHLKGKEALAYVRDRNDRMGDVDRVKRQQKFLKALAVEIQKQPKWRKILLLPEVYSNVKTDISLAAGKEILEILNVVDIDNAPLKQVPGWFMNKNGISYWNPDLEETKLIVEDLFKEK